MEQEQIVKECEEVVKELEKLEPGIAQDCFEYYQGWLADNEVKKELKQKLAKLSDEDLLTFVKDWIKSE